MLKFARRRSSSTDRESMRSRSVAGGPDQLPPAKQRAASAERSPQISSTVTFPPHSAGVIMMESPATPTKVEARTACTAPIRRVGIATAAAVSIGGHNRNSLLLNPKANFAPMTATLSHLNSVLAQVQIGEVVSVFPATLGSSDTPIGTKSNTPITVNSSTTGSSALPPPVLPRKPKVETFLQTVPHSGGLVPLPHHQLWKVELLDTSGESGYGTDNSDNSSLRSQGSVVSSATSESSPPPLPKRKPRRRVQFDSYVLLIQALKDRDLKGILATIFNVSAEALCTEDVIYHFHTAILRQDYEVTDLLVRAGCEVNTFDHRGWSALHCACSVARLDLIKLLLQNGAAVLARTHHSSQTGSQLLPPENPAFPQCLAYLRCMEECLGTVNSRIVVAAANYRATRIDELSIMKGDRLVVCRRGDVNNEMWWWVRNSRGDEGYVLRDLLALNSRHS